MSREEQLDLRIRRTHQFLQEAMIELVTVLSSGYDLLKAMYREQRIGHLQYLAVAKATRVH